jgi:hypothetical protein
MEGSIEIAALRNIGEYPETRARLHLTSASAYFFRRVPCALRAGWAGCGVLCAASALRVTHLLAVVSLPHIMCAHCGRFLVLLALAVSIGACGSDSTTGPTNHNPIITSLTVFPSAIGRTDSAIVMCISSDQDGDTLVYDWFTDGRLYVQGAPPWDHFKYNTRQPTRVFYPASVDSPIDTAFVQCNTRDRKGGVSNYKYVRIIVRS